MEVERLVSVSQTHENVTKANTPVETERAAARTLELEAMSQAELEERHRSENSIGDEPEREG